jgi:hypothetical protein
VGGQAGEWACLPITLGANWAGLCKKRNLLFLIYFTTVIVFIVAARRGSGQSKVAVHAGGVGANENSSKRMWERAWA